MLVLGSQSCDQYSGDVGRHWHQPDQSELVGFAVVVAGLVVMALRFSALGSLLPATAHHARPATTPPSWCAVEVWLDTFYEKGIFPAVFMAALGPLGLAADPQFTASLLDDSDANISWQGDLPFFANRWQQVRCSVLYCREP